MIPCKTAPKNNHASVKNKFLSVALTGRARRGLVYVAAMFLSIATVAASSHSIAPHEVARILEAAEQGDARAQSDLGVMYLDGRGVPKDEKAAVEWWRKAGNQGDVRAQYNLGVAYRTGCGVAEDEKLAAKWFQKAAAQGNSDAQHNLGLIYANGGGVPKDQAAAVEWYRRAAEQGHAVAQNNLGEMYREGAGVPADFEAAAKWFRKSAEQGYPIAQTNLGLMYDNGAGVPKDEKAAAEWHRKAAEQGHPEAQFFLGMSLGASADVQETMQGYVWLTLAIGNGFEKAVASRDVIERYLTPAQVAEAQRLAREWAAKHGKLGASAKTSAGDTGVSGRWAGSVSQPDGRPYSVIMQLSGLGGSIEYPELGCGGQLTFVSSEGSSLSYRESITHGKDACIDGGTITFTLNASGDKLNWSWSGGGTTASAILSRNQLASVKKEGASAEISADDSPIWSSLAALVGKYECYGSGKKTGETFQITATGAFLENWTQYPNIEPVNRGNVINIRPGGFDVSGGNQALHFTFQQNSPQSFFDETEECKKTK